MPRSPRFRIGKGIYRDAGGIAAVVSVRAVQRERRYPLGTPLEEIRRWREETRTELRRLVPAAVRGTLEADVDRYLRQIQHLASWRERRAELRAWCKRLGRLSRSRITSTLVRETMGTWSQADVAPKTINNRVNTLAHLYRTLDGRKWPTPCDEVDRAAVPRTPPVAVTAVIIRRVAKNLRAHERCGWIRDTKTRARFMLLASTGRRKSELEHTEREDVDLTRHVWMVRDGKGGWSPGIYLNADMLAAWRLFIQAKAWGPFNAGSFARVLRKAGWPKAVRPYNLRHSVGIALSEAGIDLADVQAHMGHKRIATTRKFYVPVLASRMEAAGRSLEGRLGWAPLPSTGKEKSQPRPGKARRRAS